ncbi:response regulator [Bremerella sp.]|uniref:hybrid sensor histidine kinase/response regulator n=1 Tax=Bremerella sp. TaxID=2795602 RepID=UPI003919EBB6
MFDEVFEIFREEAREHLGALEKSFLDLEVSTDLETRKGLIDNAFRHAHSMKSDAKVVGLPELKEAAQALEDILDELRENPESIDRAAIDRSLAQFDSLRAIYEKSQESPSAAHAPASSATEPPTLDESSETLEEASISDPVVPPPPASVPSVAEERFSVRVSSERLDRMLNLVGEVRISQRGTESIHLCLDTISEQLSELLQVTKSRERQYREIQVRHAYQEQQGENLSDIESDFKKYLTSVRQDLEHSLDQTRRLASDLGRKSGHEELLVEALENQVRQSRLLPLVMLTDSLRRVVRDLSQSLEKPIRYEVEVGSIMLDKAVIEALKDPLQHMIRNAADHGIESASQRTEAGKPEEGVIRIQASHRGQVVRLAISDDGRGIDFSRIREELVEAGELSANEVAQLSETDLSRYLFQAGFTTAEAGEVSGRGVGLDVVLEAIQRLQGSVKLESSSLEGTCFVMTVPVAVSTVRVLTVTSSGVRYGIPSSSVITTGRARREHLRDLEGSPVLSVEGQPVRWVYLADLVGSHVAPNIANSEVWSYLLVSNDGHQMAVAVDDLEDESEVLLKPLGYPLNGVPGIVGATIHADGSVQLVLDLSERGLARSQTGRPYRHAVPQPKGRILVVDDSPTTRAVLRNLLTAAGFVVRTASDGLDALEKLSSHAVDVVISDVEMPRLNGFDLARQVKARTSLPVILVTGREKEEHRLEGLNAGADAYVVKSTFEDKSLLEIIEQFF